MGNIQSRRTRRSASERLEELKGKEAQLIREAMVEAAKDDPRLAPLLAHFGADQSANANAIAYLNPNHSQSYSVRSFKNTLKASIIEAEEAYALSVKATSSQGSDTFSDAISEAVDMIANGATGEEIADFVTETIQANSGSEDGTELGAYAQSLRDVYSEYTELTKLPSKKRDSKDRSRILEIQSFIVDLSQNGNGEDNLEANA